MERLGRYDLLRRIAVGGMAEIYIARETGLAGFQRLVVVKRILPALGQDDGFVELFLDEARIAARLTHPKIVHIYELGQAEETYYIAMEYVPGCDLESLLEVEEGPLPLAEAMHVAGEVLEGLHYAHSLTDQHGVPLGVVHRDVAPKNVLVSLDGVVKIVDFGIAKARTKATVTAPGLVMGTYNYMSPEQACGRPVDRRTDVFAAGALLYRMVTGLCPYRAEGMKLVEQVRTADFTRPRDLVPELPASVEGIVLQAMRVDPEERYPTAAHMRRDVTSAARDLGLAGDADTLAGLIGRRLPHLEGLVRQWIVEEPGEDSDSEDTTAFDRDRASVLERLRALGSGVVPASEVSRRAEAEEERELESVETKAEPSSGNVRLPSTPPPQPGEWSRVEEYPGQADPDAPTAAMELPEHVVRYHREQARRLGFGLPEASLEATEPQPTGSDEEDDRETWPSELEVNEDGGDADAGEAGYGLDAPATILDQPSFPTDNVSTVPLDSQIPPGAAADGDVGDTLDLEGVADEDLVGLALPEDVERELAGQGPADDGAAGDVDLEDPGGDFVTQVTAPPVSRRGGGSGRSS